MHEQLRALWSSRDRDQGSVRGLLLAKSLPSNHLVSQQDVNDSSSSCCNDLLLPRAAQLSERWFTLVGHSLFYCKQRECSEFSGALLTDIFSPVIARVSQKVMDAFELPEADQVSP